MIQRKSRWPSKKQQTSTYEVQKKTHSAGSLAAALRVHGRGDASPQHTVRVRASGRRVQLHRPQDWHQQQPRGDNDVRLRPRHFGRHLRRGGPPPRRRWPENGRGGGRGRRGKSVVAGSFKKK